ncbi:MAG: hydroxyacylglutathione hydrolase [Wenzhouxiangella sp.]|nr:MAG: hydroxyacylglutathione hydrolase [Wenzhouxiangella sp.]
MDPRADVVMIGCGAAGAMLTAELFRRANHQINVTCIEPRARLGSGLAYSTLKDEHQLNVPASRMSARHDEPDDFVSWLHARQLLEHKPSRFFATRRCYADYLTDNLGEALRMGVHHHGLHHEPHRAVSLSRAHGGWLIALDDGTLLWCEEVVLALGNLGPADPPCGLAGIVAAPGYCHDPWAGPWPECDPEAAVAVLGMGLTAVDIVLSLERRGHLGPIHVISRHGRWPAAHADDYKPQAWPDGELSGGLSRLLKAVRRRLAREHDWHDVIDGLRPHTARLWRGLSDTEKRRFMRHLYSLWQRARHRMPQRSARILEHLEASGQLVRHATRNLVGKEQGERIRLQSGISKALEVEVLFNARGASTAVAQSRQPLLTSLLAEGLVRPGPAGLGLDCTEEGLLLSRAGLPQSGLWTLGPMRQGVFFETTAVPEIRAQCDALAGRLLARIDGRLLAGQRSHRLA